jgi:predicted permease
VPLDVGREEPARTLFYEVSPSYFATMGITVRAGRGFTDRDSTQSAPVAVVSETLARRLWPAAGAVGQRVRLPWEDDWRDVIGIVGDVRHTSIAEPPAAGVYVPEAQSPFSRGVVVVRAVTSADALAAGVRDAVRTLDPNLPVFNVRTLGKLQAEALAPARLVAGMMGAFSLLALALGAVGLYGVIAYATARRTREMGVRMALGAGRGDVLRLYVGQGLTLLGVGLTIGLVASLALAPLLASLLYGVEPTDVPTLAGVTLLLLLVGTIASYLPARRATRVDPMVALRVE